MVKVTGEHGVIQDCQDRVVIRKEHELKGLAIVTTISGQIKDVIIVSGDLLVREMRNGFETSYRSVGTCKDGSMAVVLHRCPPWRTREPTLKRTLKWPSEIKMSDIRKKF